MWVEETKEPEPAPPASEGAHRREAGIGSGAATQTEALSYAIQTFQVAT